MLLKTNIFSAKHLGKLLSQRRNFTVLGIETSCDDTCAAIVDSEKGILAAKRSHNLASQKIVGGICPFLSAGYHRKNIDNYVKECLERAEMRASDLDGVAVSTEPGLVICLKVGADKALATCRDYNVPFIPIHHMRAHALITRMIHPDLEYPFLAVLISGGHALITLAKDAESFYIFDESPMSSPGEAFDKVGRALGLSPDPHYGGVIEKLADKSDNILAYINQLPSRSTIEMNFRSIRDRFLRLIREKNDLVIEDVCCNFQHLITSYLCQRIDRVLNFVTRSDEFQGQKKSIVIAGGVAANKYIKDAIEKVAHHWDFETFYPPLKLITDNAEMVGWAGIELLKMRSQRVVPYNKLALQYYVADRTPIGADRKFEIQDFKLDQKLIISSLKPNEILRYNRIIK